MDPIVATIGEYPVRLFTLLLDIGVMIGVLASTVLAHRRGLPLVPFLDATLWVLVAAFAGARLQYAVAHWQEYASRPAGVLAVWEGGLALPGAVSVGAAAAWVAARASRLPWGRALDAAAPALALAQAIGRLGCAYAGCAFGAVVPAGSAAPALPLPDAAGVVAMRFPSQFAEAAGELALAVVLVALWARRPAPGTVAAAYLLGYGVLRMTFEPFRGDSTFVLGLPLAQIWAAVAAVAGAVALLAIAVRQRRTTARSRTGRPQPSHDLAPPATT